MHPALPIASGDNLIGLVIFVIIAIISGLSKTLQKGRPEMPEEELPRPRPPAPVPLRRPPATPPPIIIQRPNPPPGEPAVLVVTEEQVRQTLRRMRVPAERRVAPPPVVVETAEPKPRRIVNPRHEEPELPSAHPELAPHEVELPSIHPEETAEETTLPSARPAMSAASRPPDVVAAPRADAYRSQLRNRADVRRAIVLRELLGPPLALRSDW
jgi:hypothetical protein